MRLTLVVVFMAGTAMAEPSFDCTAQLNPTERQICAASQLAQLDQTMAQSYFDQMAVIEAADQIALRKEQRAWLKWRNSCGVDIGCLEQRYLNRIRGLYGTPPADGGQIGPDQVVEKRLRNGALEVVYADGRIDRMSPTDGTFETILPEGFDQAKLDAARGIVPIAIEPEKEPDCEVTAEGLEICTVQDSPRIIEEAIQVQADDFLVPDDCDDWMASVDNQLWSAVEAFLPEQDRQGYSDLVTDRPCPSRLQGHIQALNFLATK